jgi:hypothetical protein
MQHSSTPLTDGLVDSRASFSSLGAGVLLISAAFYTLRVSARHKLHKMSGTQDRHALV